LFWKFKLRRSDIKSANKKYAAPTELKILLGWFSTKMSRLRRWVVTALLEPPVWSCYALPEFMFYPNAQSVAGLMPHPERACEPLLGSDDGKWIFESIFAALKNKTVAQAA
jgi:hypothetical protein